MVSKYQFISYEEIEIPGTNVLVSHIKMNRPKKYNAVSWEMLKEINQSIEENIQTG